MSLPSTVSGFAVFPVAYSSSSTHILYGRKHVNSKKATNKILPDDRTLFLVNVPPDATEREVTLFFKPCGTVEKVVFDRDVADKAQNPESDDGESGEEDEGGEEGQDEQPPRRKKRKTGEEEKDVPPTVTPLPPVALRTFRKTGQAAHVVFLDASSVDRALALAQTGKPRPWPSSPEPRGLAHYAALYDALRPPLDVVMAHANSAIELYDYELAKTRQKSKYRKGEAIVDEDGFTLVTRGGAYGQSVGGGVGVASKAFQEGSDMPQNKKKKKEKEAFYAFQIHEKKRKELFDLQEKWEEDKAKVAKLKESRRFKPY